MTTDTTPDTGSGPRRILGFGAAACLACCVGPLLAALGAIGIATTIITLAAGTLGLVVLAAAIPPLARRRRRASCATPVEGPVAVAMPSRRDGPPLQPMP